MDEEVIMEDIEEYEGEEIANQEQGTKHIKADWSKHAKNTTVGQKVIAFQYDTLRELEYTITTHSLLHTITYKFIQSENLSLLVIGIMVF